MGFGRCKGKVSDFLACGPDVAAEVEEGGRVCACSEDCEGGVQGGGVGEEDAGYGWFGIGVVFVFHVGRL